VSNTPTVNEPISRRIYPAVEEVTRGALPLLAFNELYSGWALRFSVTMRATRCSHVIGWHAPDCPIVSSTPFSGGAPRYVRSALR
jgi:hypothetical protein